MSPIAVRLKNCGKAVYTSVRVLLFLIDIRLKKCMIKFFSKEPFELRYCLDRYKTQEICDEAVNAFLSILKLVSEWFVPNNVAFFSDDEDLNTVDLNNVNLDDDKFD